ncbi:MAG: helix-turn-helix domain-containing protein, partial [Bacteroidales bacterium]|nr:helix-turn-helix domain-containing protein [Bacteroidales bacterium]
MTQLELAEQYVTSTNVSVFLTGKAGTGKTTFLHRIAESVKKRSVVVTPTGVAAVNAAGVTIHSFFQLPLCPYLPDVKELVTEYQMPDKFKQLRKEKIKVIRTLDLLIIDEISMVRADLLDAIDMTLRRYRRNSKPFGGVQLLMIGDVQQLPPVVTDEEKPYMDKVYKSPFFFHSKALQKLHYVTIELTHIFRQQDEHFISLLNNIRDNRFDQATLDALNARYDRSFNPPDSEGYIRLTTHNYQADNVNQRKLASLTSPSFELRATVEGNFPPTSFPTDQNLILKVGAQVMFIKNDSSGHSYYNGKIATVEGYDSEEGVAVVDQEGNHIIVNPERWENIKYEVDPEDNQIKQNVDGTFIQYPLRLAWAITVHKSQGLTFDKVIIDAASAFTYGQVYVALSRCRSLEGLVLATPISPNCVFDNMDVLEFNNSFPTEESVQQGLGQFKVGYYIELLGELFDFSALMRSAERVNEIFHRYLSHQMPVETQKMNQLANNDIVNIASVGEKFRSQINKILMSNGNNIEDAFLHERIAKGVAYFSAQLEQALLTAAPLLEIEIGNKMVASDFDEWAAELRDNIQLKQLCMNRVGENGFATEVYNKAKADFLLSKENEGSSKKVSYRQRYFKKEPKPKKPPVWEETARQFKAGRSIQEIADERGVKHTTITNHLNSALEAGQLKWSDLITKEELDEISAYIKEANPQTLNEIHDHFGDRYEYYKLRTARYL